MKLIHSKSQSHSHITMNHNRKCLRIITKAAIEKSSITYYSETETKKRRNSPDRSEKHTLFVKSSRNHFYLSTQITISNDYFSLFSCCIMLRHFLIMAMLFSKIGINTIRAILLMSYWMKI